jgi:hypothetical protein
MEEERVLHNHTEAVIGAQALGFLFDWLGSDSFESPCDFYALSQVPEIQRFFHRDRETARWRNKMLVWLQERNILRLEEKRRPGRRRTKDYSWAETRRAECALWSGWDGFLGPETVKRYRTILGEHKTKELRYVVVQESLFALFEEHYGMPNGCTPTEFARSHRIPTKFAKAWVRNLEERELVCLVYVRGKHIVKTICRK